MKMNTVKIVKRDGNGNEEAQQPEQTRVRINYTVGAKGDFKPDITIEAECVETAMANLRSAHESLEAFRVEKGYKKVEG
jgi:hypothetical protein